MLNNNIIRRGVASTNIVAPGFNPAKESKNVNECRRHGTYNKTPMANTYHQIYLQVIFAVKYREAIIKKNGNLSFLLLLGI
ncbi:hypothetical protein [Mucilaginibacter sp. UYCu711]|uniref:hypothetical protein n=1 Tax=Mucilaginibacter sp. UYCu711 TaxID=3156339 RepID=UPI003D263444